MKAIVILFNGEYLSEPHRKDLIGTIGAMVGKTTTAEGKDCLKISELDDKDITKLVAAAQFNIREVIAPPYSQLQNNIIRFCEEIINVIGPRRNFDEIPYKQSFIRMMINNENFKKNHSEIINYLIHLRNVPSIPTEVSTILTRYDLLNIVGYLKEINKLIQIV